MDSSKNGYMLDTSKCSKLNTEEKIEILHEVSEWSDGAAEDMLQSLSKQELLQMLRAEIGKDRKFAGMTKGKMIEHLLRFLAEKKSEEQVSEEDPVEKPPKRPRKADNPSRVPIAPKMDRMDTKYCKNSACRAILHSEDTFCKRCSCSMCYKFDDNKDPSLWLVCCSEPPSEYDSCGMSYHLECVLKDKRAGITNKGGLDGSYNCVSCGKVNDLLGCWRKQLMIAKDTRRVDTLGYRIVLSQNLLNGTKKYQKLSEIVETAAKKLETEVGPLAGLAVKMGRGIVNRLSSGPEIQKLCGSAVQSLDLMLSSSALHLPPNKFTQSSVIRFENVCATSLDVILNSENNVPDKRVKYILWHCKANMKYPSEPTCTLFSPTTKFEVAGLSPESDYVFKVHSFCDAREMQTFEAKHSTKCSMNGVSSLLVERDHSPTTNSSSLSNPSSEVDESNNMSRYEDKIEKEGSPLDEEHITATKEQSKRNLMQSITGNQVVSNSSGTETHSLKHQVVQDLNIENVPNHSKKNSVLKDKEIMPFGNRGPTVDPFTPCKTEILQDARNSCSRKRNEVSHKVELVEDGCTDGEYEHCVKMIRQLECEGHLEKSFRVKFLTWYSLRANADDKKVVKVFIDTFSSDPTCLAGQLVDTFMKKILKKRPPQGVPSGFCTHMWH